MIHTLIPHGDDLAIVIDPQILEQLNITAETQLQLTTMGESIVITPSRKQRELQDALDRINDRFRDDLERLAK